MNYRIETIDVGFTKENIPAKLFKIYNANDEYLTLTNYGAAIINICINKSDHAEPENIIYALSDFSSYENSNLQVGSAVICTVNGQKLNLSHIVWETAEIGSNFVFLTTESKAGEINIKVGVKISWFNLNRLTVDLFITPEQESKIEITSNLAFMCSHGNVQARTFLPETYEVPKKMISVSSTPFANQAFVPLASSVSFFSQSEEMKPLSEICLYDSNLSITIYSDLQMVQIAPSTDADCVRLNHSTYSAIVVPPGNTLSSRCIYGFDLIKNSGMNGFFPF